MVSLTCRRSMALLLHVDVHKPCIAVEMEVAGVQAVCDFYGFELYDFLAAGDVLVEGDYTIDELSDANYSLDKLLVALQIIERI